MLEGFERNDPPRQPRLVIPLSVINHPQAKANASKSQQKKSIADLCTIGFYYLLQVGEYTYNSPSNQSQIIAFRISNVCFWENDTIIQLSLFKKQVLKQALSYTLTIDNQKNGVKQHRSPTTESLETRLAQ